MRVAYFINQYPKVSHSFIRREIRALEELGVSVQRIALRGWDGEIVDADDIREREQTQFVLKVGYLKILLSVIKVIAFSPCRFFCAFKLALKMGGHADRPLPFHLIYLAEACQIVPWMKTFGATHVHAHFGSNSAEVVMLANVLGGPPFSFTVHGPEEFDKPVFLGLPEKIKRSAFVVAISFYGRSQLFRWVAQDSWSKVKVVHCGLEKSFYDIAPRPVTANSRLVCVGRLCEQKGQLLLLEAAYGLARKGIQFDLVLAGDGEMRAEIERLITAYGLMGKVRITGWISGQQVREEILGACGMVLPSFAEGLPVVIMEAMALRRPVISTYVAGIPELVIPGINGWLVPAGSVVELMEAMEDMLAKSSEQLAVMGDAAYARVTARHDINTEAKKLVELFRGASS
ncbi:MAG: glycosyltransferase family 4 protein [Gallionella sp.]|jgi:colanic acid/amylovoran biosynthesis glycosyltransferase